MKNEQEEKPYTKEEKILINRILNIRAVREMSEQEATKLIKNLHDTENGFQRFIDNMANNAHIRMYNKRKHQTNKQTKLWK